MRKIKYRYWNIDKNKMYVGGTERGNLKIIEESILCGYALMQYTGVEDVNNKEIYEGDILILTYEGISGFTNKRNASVKFKNGGFGVDFANEFIFLSELNILNMEIIDNIYENKGLVI